MTLSSSSNGPLNLSQGLLRLLGIQLDVQHGERVPQDASLVVVSNHRSLLDAPLLMAAVNRPVRFACHHYMSQVPGLREMVTAMGCLPLDQPGTRQGSFFSQASHLLQAQEAIGIFPEGPAPMVRQTDPARVGEFQRGFAHLALRSPVPDLTILPMAIASTREASSPAFPLRLLSHFDPSEPLFDQPGWHPAVLYRQVNLLVGHPIRVNDRLRSHYRGREAGKLAAEITDCCQSEIANLLRLGCA
ncbi:1-acyl-sn-glycerol-3-phosphate acyltransferase [filamentous cyanobacterium CCP5]|nr:1-acyl-sn-glycerol-3-phosphate acyltransferase [filamentous cyanobacterium CCP5]